MSAPLFPLFLRLEGRKVVLVGGGRIASGKLSGLLEAGAEVTVVAPEVAPDLERPSVRIVRRCFEPDDLAGAWLAVAAATPDVNREVRQAGEALHVIVNAVDDPAAASAFTGGVLHRGGITVAISTGGEAPALAGLLREALSALLPAEADEWLEVARRARREWQASGVPYAERRPRLLRALNALYDGEAHAADAPRSATATGAS